MGRKTPDWHAEALRLFYERGMRPGPIAAQLGQKIEAVKYVIYHHREANAPTEKRAGLHEPSEYDVAEARRLYAKRIPVTHIMAQLKIPFQVIMDAVKGVDQRSLA